MSRARLRRKLAKVHCTYYFATPNGEKDNSEYSAGKEAVARERRDRMFRKRFGMYAERCLPMAIGVKYHRPHSIIERRHIPPYFGIPITRRMNDEVPTS